MSETPVATPGQPDQQPADLPGGVVDDPAECAKWNTKNQTHDHHIYPQAFRDEFKRIGINVDDFTITIPADKHIGANGIHTVFDWNGEWFDFFENLPEASLTEPQQQKWQTKAEALATELLNRAGMADLPIHPFGAK